MEDGAVDKENGGGGGGMDKNKHKMKVANGNGKVKVKGPKSNKTSCVTPGKACTGQFSSVRQSYLRLRGACV